MRRDTAVIAIAIAVATALAAACGAGESAAPPPTDAAQPTAVAPTSQPSPAPTPTSEESPAPPEPTDDGRAEVLIAVAGGVAFRRSEGAWQQVELPPTARDTEEVQLEPDGLSIADRDTAYLWGWIGEDDSGLLRTDDAGASWSDASSTLPPDVQLITDLAFSPDRAWLVSGGLFAGISVFDSSNPVSTWRPYAVRFAFAARAGHLFIVRGARVDVVYNGRLLKQLFPSSEAFDAIDVAGGGFYARDVAVSGERAWLAGLGARGLAIVAGSVGEPWLEQEIDGEHRPASQIFSIDVRGESGVACGETDVLDLDVDPICLFTDDGARWLPAILPDAVAGMRIARVVRAAGTTAWAVAEDPEAVLPLRLLRSDDGGRSWVLAEQPFGRTTSIVDFVRTSAAP